MSRTVVTVSSLYSTAQCILSMVGSIGVILLFAGIPQLIYSPSVQLSNLMTFMLGASLITAMVAGNAFVNYKYRQYLHARNQAALQSRRASRERREAADKPPDYDEVAGAQPPPDYHSVLSQKPPRYEDIAIPGRFNWGNMIDETAGCSSNSNSSTSNNDTNSCSTSNDPTNITLVKKNLKMSPFHGHVNSAFRNDSDQPHATDSINNSNSNSNSNSNNNSNHRRKLSYSNDLKQTVAAPVHRMISKFRRSRSYTTDIEEDQKQGKTLSFGAARKNEKALKDGKCINRSVSDTGIIIVPSRDINKCVNTSNNVSERSKSHSHGGAIQKYFRQLNVMYNADFLSSPLVSQGEESPVESPSISRNKCSTSLYTFNEQQKENTNTNKYFNEEQKTKSSQELGQTPQRLQTAKDQIQKQLDSQPEPTQKTSLQKEYEESKNQNEQQHEYIKTEQHPQTPTRNFDVALPKLSPRSPSLSSSPSPSQCVSPSIYLSASSSTDVKLDVYDETNPADCLQTELSIIGQEETEKPSATDQRTTDLRTIDLQTADARPKEMPTAELQTEDLQAVDVRTDLQTADVRQAAIRTQDVQTTDVQTEDLQAVDVRQADTRTESVRIADLQTTDVGQADIRTKVVRARDVEREVPLATAQRRSSLQESTTQMPGKDCTQDKTVACSIHATAQSPGEYYAVNP